MRADSSRAARQKVARPHAGVGALGGGEGGRVEGDVAGCSRRRDLEPCEAVRGRRRRGASPGAGRGAQIRRRSAASGRTGPRSAGRRRKAPSSDREVGGEDGEAAEGLHALEEVADLDVGVAVVAVLHPRPLAEEASAPSKRTPHRRGRRRRRCAGGSSPSRRCICSHHLAGDQREEVEREAFRDDLRGERLPVHWAGWKADTPSPRDSRRSPTRRARAVDGARGPDSITDELGCAAGMRSSTGSAAGSTTWAIPSERARFSWRRRARGEFRVGRRGLPELDAAAPLLAGRRISPPRQA